MIMIVSGPSAAPSSVLGKSGISWGWLLAVGILFTLLGLLGLGMTYWLSVVAVFWGGVLAVVGGIAQILDAFHHKGWKGIVWHVIIGLIYIVAGFAMITMPVSAAFWLTLFLALSLVVVGIVRIVMAFQIRGQGPVWVAVLLSGIVSVALGAMVYGTVTPPGAEALATPAGQLAWIRSWGWVIGLFVAIEMITEGVALISLALAAKSATHANAQGAAGAPSA
jgi:uncharacterized membrane protein HdeD (DUF308 family)